MIANYAKTAWRASSRYKQHSLLNVAGLAVGLVATLLVAQYARYELSYDKQQPDGERVFRVESDFSALGSVWWSHSTWCRYVLIVLLQFDLHSFYVMNNNEGDVDVILIF